MSIIQAISPAAGPKVSTAYQHILFRYSDAMVFMKKGKVVASGKPDEVLNADLLEQFYDIPMTIVP